MFRVKKILAACLVAASLALVSACGWAGGGLGEEGEPVDIKVGYQPYYTESWTGVVMRDKELWKKHLPEGSNVDFEVGLQGSVIVNRMIAGKEFIGYMGDMPAIVATTKRSTKDLRIVSTLGTAQDQCNVLMVDNNTAPEFDDPQKAIEWLDGKTVATPKGSCTDRFAQETFQKYGIQPGSYLNQSIEVISTNFQNDKIDAAAIWEPTAARLVNEGAARRVASGVNSDVTDAGFLVMSKDLMDQRPDVVKGFLQAELEAQKFLSNPDNSNEIAQMAVDQTEGFNKKTMWKSLVKDWPEAKGGNPTDTRINQPFIVTEDVQTQIQNSTDFLYDIESINVENLPEGAVDDSTAREVLKESGGSSPVGAVKALPESEFNK